MKIIIDNNILFSLMKPSSSASEIFSLMKWNYIVPDFILKEFEKHKPECETKSGLTKSGFEQRKKEVFGEISFVELTEYENLLKEAAAFSPDEDDSPYFALALKYDCPIWSNDTELKKQEKITVLSTKEMIELI